MHRSAITQTRLHNWLNAGRGYGFFSKYHPWIQVSRQDHGSSGYSHQTPNPFTGRAHHFLSNLEKSVFRVTFTHPCVTDNREQFPIWPEPHPSPLTDLRRHLGEETPPESDAGLVPGTLAIAHRLNIPHAYYVGLDQPFVHTTDQLLTIQRSGRPAQLLALAIKPIEELRGRRRDDKRSTRNSRAKLRRATFRKLRLERAYWHNQNIPWLLITERQIAPQIIRNLEFGHSSWQQHTPTQHQWECLKKLRIALRRAAQDRTCSALLDDFAMAEQLPREEAIRLFKLGLITGALSLDLRRPIVLTGAIPWLPTETQLPVPPWSPLSSVWGQL